MPRATSIHAWAEVEGIGTLRNTLGLKAVVDAAYRYHPKQ